MSLCDAGVDAVLTLAFVDKATSKKLRKGSNKKYVSEYYYNHIWNYRNISKDNATASHKIQYSAELILFDLRTLESVVVLHQKENIILHKHNSQHLNKIYPLEHIEKLLNTLNPSRVDKYGDWISVGIMCFNMNSYSFDLWHKWSQKSYLYDDIYICMYKC